MKKICFTFPAKLYIMYKSAGCGSVWLERTAGGREVAGSNPVTPMKRGWTFIVGSPAFCRVRL